MSFPYLWRDPGKLHPRPIVALLLESCSQWRWLFPALTITLGTKGFMLTDGFKRTGNLLWLTRKNSPSRWVGYLSWRYNVVNQKPRNDGSADQWEKNSTPKTPRSIWRIRVWDIGFLQETIA